MITYYKPHITEDEKKAVKRVLDSGWLTTGAEVRAFEEEFAEAHGCKYALAVSSATAGLHLAMLCSPYVECKVPNYTFIATFEAAAKAGKSIKLIGTPGRTTEDGIELKHGYNIELKEDMYGTLVPVHIGGELVDLSQVKSSRAFVVEDCAHRFPGGTYNRGVIQVFSFYANKPITCGEGGMVCTDNADYYERMKSLYYHGMDRSSFERGAGLYSVTTIGNKYNLSDVHAAIGREQLKKIDVLRDARQEIADGYIDAFSGSTIATRPKNKENSWHLFMIELDTSAQADKIRLALTEAEISYGRHYQPLTTWQAVRELSRYDNKQTHIIDNDKFERSMSLPIYVDLTEAEQKSIIETVLKAAE